MFPKFITGVMLHVKKEVLKIEGLGVITGRIMGVEKPQVSQSYSYTIDYNRRKEDKTGHIPLLHV